MTQPHTTVGDARIDHVLPRRQLSVWHAVSVCVGMVIGAGIFKTTPLAAANLASGSQLMLAWAIGGGLSLVGALCFAEMAAAFPDTGGDYFFLRSAYGGWLGYLFAWSRFAVIHTGSMAMLAFVFGDYLGQIVHFGPYDSAVFATLIIVALTLINLAGIQFGIGTQVTLMMIVLLGLLSVGAAGVWLWWQDAPAVALKAVPTSDPQTHLGVAMVFVFLAYGGWSDAATLSAEMRDAKHGITRALLIGMSVVTALYLVVNWAFLRGLGLQGLAHSNAPAADLMLLAFGKPGQYLIVAVVAVTSITVMNAIMIAGARTTYAAARDTGALRSLAQWHEVRGTPYAAIIAIGSFALLLVGFGTYTRGGFETMVDYLSPVYWLFLTLSALAVIVLRRRFPQVARPFRVPWYPWLPLLFAVSSAYVLYSSLIFVKTGALVGVAVLLVGALLLVPLQWRSRRR
jgi:basic amino acid/polyamine antiporter, APA family